MNREIESAGMRPLAKAVTKSLENVRVLLREQVSDAGYMSRKIRNFRMDKFDM